MRFLADENFDGRIIRGLLRRMATLDLVRAVDVGLSGADDPSLLEWAAKEGCVVLTHDVTTMAGFAYARVAARLSMPGVVEVAKHVPIGQAIDDLLLLAIGSVPGEWEGQVIYLPL
jgi:hypothetical protein